MPTNYSGEGMFSTAGLFFEILVMSKGSNHFFQSCT